MDKIPPVISITNIVKTYKIGAVSIPALRGISLEVNQGDFLMIIGRNGSGKSTLLHQLGLLDRPDAGQLFLNGKEVFHVSETERSKLRLKYIGYIFQEYALMAELSAFENVMLPALMLETATSSAKRAKELLAKIGLNDKINHLPTQLSGGEQQKVAIARALINHPNVILADEPTANLDSIAAKDVIDIFKSLNEKDGITIVMITHEQEEMAYAKKIITLADGVIV